MPLRAREMFNNPDNCIMCRKAKLKGEEYIAGILLYACKKIKNTAHFGEFFIHEKCKSDIERFRSICKWFENKDGSLRAKPYPFLRLKKGECVETIMKPYLDDFFQTVKSECEICACCGKSDIKRRKCAKCETVIYCDADCQLLDWKDHKRECKEIK